MKKPLNQFLVLGALAVVIGALNNLRSDAHIEWVRYWKPFEAVAGSEPEPGPSATPDQPAVSTVATPTLSPDEVAAMVSENQGITDIGIDQAKALFDYAADFTFWIDARSPDLFEEGHIRGAELLYFYEQNSYLGDIQAKIEERQPIALIIYCKGKDCTDSHHLAEDLTGLGYSNIFVYKDGFQDWFRAGYPIEGSPAGTDPQSSAEPEIDEGLLMAEAAALVDGNVGITDIDLETARKIYRYAGDFTFWIDARDDTLFRRGHIEGAHQVYYYEKNSYLPEVQTRIDEQQPVALILYCKGPECTDSHHLAEDMAAMGFANIFVYRGGYDAWYEAGLPIAGDMAAATTSSVEAQTPRELPEEKPPGMYLEHILRDMIPFVFGIVLMAGWKRFSTQKPWLIASSIFVGAFFIYAAVPKMNVPLQFASNIWNYAIAPGVLINPTALIMPALELICGLALVLGFWRKGASIWVSALLVLFIIAVGFNVLRGHEFNCGCTSTTTMITDVYLQGWNDKLTLILRDIGLLVMSFAAFKIGKRNPA